MDSCTNLCVSVHLGFQAEDLLQNSEEENEDKDGLTCAVCLDIYISPHICQPCGHCFCEPCLRTIAKDQPRNTPCPLCRTLISKTNPNRGNCVTEKRLIDPSDAGFGVPLGVCQLDSCSNYTILPL